jgi:hypothetical protein
MDIQTDISWIQAELSKVKDPELISAFKSLLKYRNKQTKIESDFDLSMNRALLDKPLKIFFQPTMLYFGLGFLIT